jgi:hypothetical protein
MNRVDHISENLKREVVEFVEFAADLNRQLVDANGRVEAAESERDKLLDVAHDELAAMRLRAESAERRVDALVAALKDNYEYANVYDGKVLYFCIHCKGGQGNNGGYDHSANCIIKSLAKGGTP